MESKKLALIQLILALQDTNVVEAILKFVKQHNSSSSKPSPLKTPAPYRQFGFAKGQITYVAPDFDETPPGFEDYKPS